MRLNDVGQTVRGLIGSMNIGKAVLAINAASALTVKTTSALAYVINGIYYSKAILSAQTLVTGGDAFYTQPASTTVYYVLGIDSSGTVKTFQGTYSGQVWNAAATSASQSANQQGVVGNGAVPDVDSSTYAVFGMIKVVTGATTFLPGTDALDKASVTFTFYDLAMIPGTNP